MFSFGKNKSSSQSQSSSSSYGMATSSDQSDAYSSSAGSSLGLSRSSDSVFGADIFQALFRDSTNVAGAIAANAGGLTGAANNLFDSGSSFLAELGELAGDGPAGAGENYLAGRLTGPNDLLEENIAQIGKDLEQFFGESVLPQIRGEAIAAGGLGGTRHGVAEGVAGRGLVSEFGRAVLGLRTNDLNQRDAAATTLAGTQGNRRLGAATTALSALPGQLGLLEMGSMAMLQPFMALAQILGGPAVLNEAESLSTSSDTATSSSSSRGSSFAKDQAYSQSSSTGKSGGFNFGIGL